MLSFTHITLATGDSRRSPRHEVAQEALEILRPLVDAGNGEIPGRPGYVVAITREGTDALYTILRCHTPRAPWEGEPTPVVTCGLAQRADAAELIWASLLQLHEQCYPRRGRASRHVPAEWHRPPVMPAELPWLGVVLLPGLGRLRKQDVGWLGDFERCLAWAILEGCRGH